MIFGNWGPWEKGQEAKKYLYIFDLFANVSLTSEDVSSFFSFSGDEHKVIRKVLKHRDGSLGLKGSVTRKTTSLGHCGEEIAFLLLELQRSYNFEFDSNGKYYVIDLNNKTGEIHKGKMYYGPWKKIADKEIEVTIDMFGKIKII